MLSNLNIRIIKENVVFKMLLDNYVLSEFGFQYTGHMGYLINWNDRNDGFVVVENCGSVRIQKFWVGKMAEKNLFNQWKFDLMQDVFWKLSDTHHVPLCIYSNWSKSKSFIGYNINLKYNISEKYFVKLNGIFHDCYIGVFSNCMISIFIPINIKDHKFTTNYKQEYPEYIVNFKKAENPKYIIGQITFKAYENSCDLAYTLIKDGSLYVVMTPKHLHCPVYMLKLQINITEKVDHNLEILNGFYPFLDLKPHSGVKTDIKILPNICDQASHILLTANVNGRSKIQCWRSKFMMKNVHKGFPTDKKINPRRVMIWENISTIDAEPIDCIIRGPLCIVAASESSIEVNQSGHLINEPIMGSDAPNEFILHIVLAYIAQGITDHQRIDNTMDIVNNKNSDALIFLSWKFIYGSNKSGFANGNARDFELLYSSSVSSFGNPPVAASNNSYFPLKPDLRRTNISSTETKIIKSFPLSFISDQTNQKNEKISSKPISQTDEFASYWKLFDYTETLIGQNGNVSKSIKPAYPSIFPTFQICQSANAALLMINNTSSDTFLVNSQMTSNPILEINMLDIYPLINPKWEDKDLLLKHLFQHSLYNEASIEDILRAYFKDHHLLTANDKISKLYALFRTLISLPNFFGNKISQNRLVTQIYIALQYIGKVVAEFTKTELPYDILEKYKVIHKFNVLLISKFQTVLYLAKLEDLFALAVSSCDYMPQDYSFQALIDLIRARYSISLNKSSYDNSYQLNNATTQTSNNTGYNNNDINFLIESLKIPHSTHNPQFKNNYGGSKSIQLHELIALTSTLIPYICDLTYQLLTPFAVIFNICGVRASLTASSSGSAFYNQGEHRANVNTKYDTDRALTNEFWYVKDVNNLQRNALSFINSYIITNFDDTQPSNEHALQNTNNNLNFDMEKMFSDCKFDQFNTILKWLLHVEHSPFDKNFYTNPANNYLLIFNRVQLLTLLCAFLLSAKIIVLNICAPNPKNGNNNNANNSEIRKLISTIDILFYLVYHISLGLNKINTQKYQTAQGKNSSVQYGNLQNDSLIYSLEPYRFFLEFNDIMHLYNQLGPQYIAQMNQFTRDYILKYTYCDDWTNNKSYTNSYASYLPIQSYAKTPFTPENRFCMNGTMQPNKDILTVLDGLTYQYLNIPTNSAHIQKLIKGGYTSDHDNIVISNENSAEPNPQKTPIFKAKLCLSCGCLTSYYQSTNLDFVLSPKNHTDELITSSPERKNKLSEFLTSTCATNSANNAPDDCDIVQRWSYYNFSSRCLCGSVWVGI